MSEHAASTSGERTRNRQPPTEAGDHEPADVAPTDEGLFGDWVYEVFADRAPHPYRTARELVHDRCAWWGLDPEGDLAQTVSLVAHELLVAALRRGTAALTLCRDGDRLFLRVVSDESRPAEMPSDAIVERTLIGRLVDEAGGRFADEDHAGVLLPLCGDRLEGDVEPPMFTPKPILLGSTFDVITAAAGSGRAALRDLEETIARPGPVVVDRSGRFGFLVDVDPGPAGKGRRWLVPPPPPGCPGVTGRSQWLRPPRRARLWRRLDVVAALARIDG